MRPRGDGCMVQWLAIKKKKKKKYSWVIILTVTDCVSAPPQKKVGFDIQIRQFDYTTINLHEHII